MDSSSNRIAVAVVPGLSDEHPGAVALRGFLHAPKGARATDEVRLFSDEGFREEYRFKRGDILHRVSGGDDPHRLKDVVWLKRHTTIMRCVKGPACDFAEVYETDDDPGGPRRPSYP